MKTKSFQFLGHITTALTLFSVSTVAVAATHKNNCHCDFHKKNKSKLHAKKTQGKKVSAVKSNVAVTPIRIEPRPVATLAATRNNQLAIASAVNGQKAQAATPLAKAPSQSFKATANNNITQTSLKMSQSSPQRVYPDNRNTVNDPKTSGSILRKTPNQLLTSNQTSATVQQSPWSVDTWHSYSGSALTVPLSNMRPDVNSGELDPDDIVNVGGNITAYYSINPNYTVSGILNYSWYPVSGHRFTFNDPVIKLRHAHLLQVDQLNIAGDVRYFIPVSEFTRSLNTLGSLRFNTFTKYQFKESRWSVATAAWAQFTGYSVASELNRSDVRLQLAPQAYFKAMPTLEFYTIYYINSFHNVGDSFAFNHGGTALEPGLNWNITKWLTFNPFLNIFPEARINADTTTYGLAVTISLL